jgi:hypothetical protein
VRLSSPFSDIVTAKNVIAQPFLSQRFLIIMADETMDDILFVGNHAHERSVLKNVTHVRVHSSVKEVGVCTFENCTKMVSVELNNGQWCRYYHPKCFVLPNGGLLNKLMNLMYLLHVRSENYQDDIDGL